MNSKKRILIVDDEPRIVKLLALKLRLCGYDIVTAASGPEALEKIRQESPDLVVLDIIMPGMDGLEVIRQVRGFSAIPVIVITARPDNIAKALALGADDGIPKPFNPDRLADRIKAALSSAR